MNDFIIKKLKNQVRSKLRKKQNIEYWGSGGRKTPSNRRAERGYGLKRMICRMTTNLSAQSGVYGAWVGRFSWKRHFLLLLLILTNKDYPRHQRVPRTS